VVGGEGVFRLLALGRKTDYCVINDVCERHFKLERGGRWDKGGVCDSFGPIDPWLVTTDEIDEIGKVAIWLEVGHRIRVVSSNSSSGRNSIRFCDD
jgi:2-keto-4-pentenoate hydratase/2-oxohepta-3-ene-1,7-dioic acid hydratase in catechol pathway